MAQTITTKDDYTFVLSDTDGAIRAEQGHGLFYQDTRYLSRLEMTVNGQTPQPLSYNADRNISVTFRSSTTYLSDQLSALSLAFWQAISITRQRIVQRGLLETLDFTNYLPVPARLEVMLRVGTDFADMFEVRGYTRADQQVHRIETEVSADGQTVSFVSKPYHLKNIARWLNLHSSLKPSRVEQIDVHNDGKSAEVQLHFVLELAALETKTLALHIAAETPIALEAAYASQVVASQAVFKQWEAACTKVETGDYALNHVYQTATNDIRSLLQQEPQGLIVTAGLPWYFTLFGRDSLITAIQTLTLNPQIAIDTLRMLAAYQATEYDDEHDAEPGKILHELRRGDLTLTGEMPFGPYYGSVDSTPLFILGFVEALKWTGDQKLFDDLWPNIERALAWADQYGDMDGDGYIKYKRRSSRGIRHQGWKDSDESMGGIMGHHPEQPLALVEVQGYYYAALMGLAEILPLYGKPDQQALIGQLTDKATRLKANFNRDFWWEQEGTFVQALDAKMQPVKSVTSNIGHCLWSGIVDDDKAERAAARLVQPDMLCGWGVRTMASSDATYNPISYHNGSVWPHDNSLVIAGLKRYGFDQYAVRVAAQVLEAAAQFEQYRLPELYCGFDRAASSETAPVAYPVSCSPQAWAAGTPFLVLQSLLGLEPDVQNGTVKTRPVWLPGTSELTLHGLRVGTHRLDLSFKRADNDEDGYTRLTLLAKNT